MKGREKSYEILAEYYNEKNELVLYVVINKYGKVMQVKKETLEQWS